MLMGWKTLEVGLQSLTGGLTEKVVSVHGELVAGLGMTGALALYLTLGILAVLALWRMVKLSFDVIRCVAIPALAVAFVGAWLMPFSFYHILPVTAVLFSGILLLKG
jgi:hypothetical protein